MRLYFTLLFAFLAANGFSQVIIVSDFFGPIFPTPGLVFPPTGEPCLNAGIHTALPFLGFGNSCFEQSLQQIRVVAPMLDGIINSDQNPALLHRPRAYQAARLEITPWQTGAHFNPYSSALKASIQRQSSKGRSWSIRYENFSLSPLLKPQPGFFFSDIPSIGSLVRLAYASPLSEHWSMGFAVKYASRRVGENAFSSSFNDTRTVAADLGFSYQNSKNISEWQKLNWQWGFSLTNLGAKVRSETVSDQKQALPTALSMGFLLEQEFQLTGASLFRIRGAYQFNKLLVPSPCQFCDDNANDVPDDQEYSAFGGMLVSFSDSPNGLQGELQEINHQFDMSVLYQFNNHFSVNAKASLFYQHPNLGAVQYLATQLGCRLRSIHFDLVYWRPNAAKVVTTHPQLGLSLGYQHFFPAS